MWKSDPYNYSRRPTTSVKIGKLLLGGTNPIRVQSMANTDTNDVENSVKQGLKIADAGGELVRYTVQGSREADSVKIIHQQLKEQGNCVPLVADIHFNSKIANITAHFLEKVRINPGNYTGNSAKKSAEDYTDEVFLQEFEKIRERFTELLGICKKHNTAIRIGVNHGSLSDRMMNRYGNSPEGMVESCMEFLQICQEEDFHDIVISMKSSNTVLMMQSVRLLVERMEKANLHYPIHLGVTEAGDGEDGRIKSAVGIGGLLADGMGDTIRVSLSEEPECEIPVALKLVNYISQREKQPKIELKTDKPFDIKPFTRRKTKAVKNIGGENLPVVISKKREPFGFQADYYFYNEKTVKNNEGETFSVLSKTEFEKSENLSDNDLIFIQLEYRDLDKTLIKKLKEQENIVILLASNHINSTGEIRAFVHTLLADNCQTPVILEKEYNELDLESFHIKSATDLGVLFVDGLGDGLFLKNSSDTVSNKQVISTSFGILQASRVRTSKTEFISCPGCGRTLFQLQEVIGRVKNRTSHLKGLKIGIMGCIVNGPGEMADADYGYVGAGRGKISLYKKQECVRRNIPEANAVEELVGLIKEHGDWTEPK